MSYANIHKNHPERAKKHAQRSHTCACGRVIKGNAFYFHRKRCAKAIERRIRKGLAP